MRLKYLVTASLLAAGLAGCSSGDIGINPSTNVSNSNNTNNNGGGDGGDDDVCASYVNSAGQTVQGTYDGTNCTYSPSFVDAGNNLMVDLTIPALPEGGAHIFQGSLFVGESYSSTAELQAAGITEGGDGPVLTIEAGATIAFPSTTQFMVINRGSQLFAVGTPEAPITFTSVSDVEGTVDPFDVQQWGGIVIDGFGVTNACQYTGSVATGDLALAGECNVDSEGSAGLDENQYGGANNDDSSGRLEYVVVKHTGAAVGNGDELNGITFSAVGRNTVVRNLEVYSVYDDGIEFFGGAVNVENYLAMYVRDDSIDIDSGYAGTIANALVVQSEADGNHCIEADGIAGYGDLAPAAQDNVIAQGLQSNFTVNNLTCVLSAHGEGTHDPSAGWLLREGLFATIQDSMLIGSFVANSEVSATDNYCLSIQNPHTEQAATDGNLVLDNVVVACAEPTDAADFDEAAFATAGGDNVFATIPSGTAVIPTAAAASGLQLLEGAPSVYSIPWATSQLDGAALPAGTQPAANDYLGASSLGGTDWTQGWTYGLHPDLRGADLWFE